MPKLVNHAGGSGFAIGEPLSARAGAAEASRANPGEQRQPRRAQLQQLATCQRVVALERREQLLRPRLEVVVLRPELLPHAGSSCLKLIDKIDL